MAGLAVAGALALGHRRRPDVRVRLVSRWCGTHCNRCVNWLGDCACSGSGWASRRHGSRRCSSMHLAGLTLLLGGTFVICLRLFGIGFSSGSQAQLTRDVAPWRTAGLALMLISGALIFTGGAASYFEGQWFRRKMTLLLIALVFNCTWFRAVTNARENQFNPLAEPRYRWCRAPALVRRRRGGPRHRFLLRTTGHVQLGRWENA